MTSDLETKRPLLKVQKHRALGCVVGSAVGDALGAPFEFGPAGEWSKQYPQPVIGGIGEMTGSRLWAPGEATDDTQMAVIEAETLIKEGLDYGVLYERFKAWCERPDTKDVGTTTSAALRDTTGYPGAAARVHARTGGGHSNGSVMRAAPSAVWLAHNEEVDLTSAAMELSAVTHAHPEAVWSRVILTHILVAGIRGANPIDAVGDAAALVPEGVRQTFLDVLSDEWQPSASDRNGRALICLAQAVWAVRGADGFADAVTRAIDLGDDADTVAAVTGAIAGSRWGIQSIPSRWAAYVHANVWFDGEMRRYGVEDLHNLVYALAPTGDWPFTEPESHGPVEIQDGVHAASMTGVKHAGEDWAVISLSRTRGRYDDRPYRRVHYLIDQPNSNPDIGAVVRDAVDAIDAFVEEGRQVVVHCHGGQSRTGLVLRAWLMKRNGWTDAQAIDSIEERWPRLALWQDEFTEFLDEEWLPGPIRRS